MATKIKIMKMLQEIRGFSELGRLQPAPKPSALFLMQLRTRRAEAQRPRRQIEIAFDLRDIATLPTPVQITHVQTPVTTAS
jgi:hypothetical protein